MILDFSRDWMFSKEGETPKKIDLPYDAMIHETRDGECLNGVNSGYFPGGKYSYEKGIYVNEEDISKSFVLHFEGVYQDCKVYVNGVIAFSHFYGYTPFDVEITSFLKAGDNTITVSVDNSLEPNCRWYSGSGIYRPVKLLVREKIHIERVHIETVSIRPAVIKVEVETTEETNISIEIWDGNRLVATSVPGLITIPSAKLWSSENPYLYTCVIKTDKDEKRIEFGIRELKWSSKTGLTVNGKRVLLRGGCIHHDHGILGANEYRDAEERRIRILKENGFNAVRIAHHPASQVTLNACDKIGMYVMNETFDGWYIPKTYHDYSRVFNKEWNGDVEAMVESSRNHPSVIMYSIGNEVSETATEKGVRTCKALRDYVHSLDPSRPVTAGINVLLNVYSNMGMGVYSEKGEYKREPLKNKKKYKEKKSGSEFFNAMTQKLGKLMFFMAGGKRGDKASLGAAESLDILGLNYASSRYDADAAKYPDRIMVGAETMASDLPYNWERVKKYPQLIGDFVWSAWDYLGETCMGWTYESYKGLPLLANQGMIDITGKPLASMGFMQVVWGLRKVPYIAVRPINHNGESPRKGSWQFTDAIDSWNWPGFEGEKAVVEVYSIGDSVRLILNGKEIGTRKLKDYKAIFRLPYRSGVLKAEALGGKGSLISSFSLETGERDTRITAIPGKRILSLDDNDLCYLPIEFTDRKGNLKPWIEEEIEVKTEGSVTLLALGSALYKTDESFFDYRHTTYRGRCLGVIKGKEKGKGRVTIKAKGIKSVEIELEVK